MEKCNAIEIKATGQSRAKKLIMEDEQFLVKCQNMLNYRGDILPTIPVLLGVNSVNSNTITKSLGK